jgi:hypothetical protein
VSLGYRVSRQVALRAAGGECGFTVLEALIATALVALIGFVGLAACKTVAHVMLASSSASRSADSIEAQATQLHEEAATAFAVFVPALDTNGRPNAGQELDFYAKSDDGRAVLWRYVYDAAARTLRRWDYDPGGAFGVRDANTGLIDPAAAYPPLTNVTRFRATALPADALGDAQRNVYAGIAGLFGSAPQALPVRYTVPGLDAPQVAGGNGVVQVLLAGASSARVIHLAAGSMPTGFTVTGLPLWHAIVYRVDQSHRFLAGLAGKSHVFINARVEVSYDGWVTPKKWCDFNLLGAPDGLDGHDPHADYKPDEPIEQADSILAACRARFPLPPLRDGPDNPSDPDSIHPPLPDQTAPPCWTNPGPAGRCWPEKAPPDWVPPSPFPQETAPPAWCQTHAQSPTCNDRRAGHG